MKSGSALGISMFVALTACVGAGVAGGVALLGSPPLLVTFDLAFGCTRDEPPFRWLEPMSWMLPLSALLGAVTGAVLACNHLRRRRRTG